MEIACYYYPNYHLGDPRNHDHRGRDWSEWKVVQSARPRFESHQQPKVPLWGYEDESNPAVMSRKIRTASDHGVDAFIFDWYWYEDGPFLEGALESGFLNAPNRQDLQFALMWANHDWMDIHPWDPTTPPKLLYPGKLSEAAFEHLTDHVVEQYFSKPNYWCLEGHPYFSFYHLMDFVKGLGSVQEACKALDRFRRKTEARGLKTPHFNVITWGVGILPGEADPIAQDRFIELCQKLGIDSVNSYVWTHHAEVAFPTEPYESILSQYLEYYDNLARSYPLPYFPNITMGWDPSPRANPAHAFEQHGYPFSGIVTGNTPTAFAKACSEIMGRVKEASPAEQIVTVNCWNEWTEGSYLEPDEVHGGAYLRALQQSKKSFESRSSKSIVRKPAYLANEKKSHRSRRPAEAGSD